MTRLGAWWYFVRRGHLFSPKEALELYNLLYLQTLIDEHKPTE